MPPPFITASATTTPRITTSAAIATTTRERVNAGCMAAFRNGAHDQRGCEIESRLTMPEVKLEMGTRSA